MGLPRGGGVPGHRRRQDPEAYDVWFRGRCAPYITLQNRPGRESAESVAPKYDPGKRGRGLCEGRHYLRGSGPMGILNEARREFIAAPDSSKGQIVYKWPDHNIRKFS